MKEYRKFLRNILIMFISAFILIPAIFIFIGYSFIGKNIYSKGARNIQYWIDVKNQRADELTQKGNKIIFLAGSNLLHGLDSKYAEQVTGLPVLNYGLHAAFGPYALEMGKKIAKPGDIVIIPLEFTYYTETSSINHQSPYMEYLISYLPDEFYKADLYEKFIISLFLVQHWIVKPTFNYEKNSSTKDFENQLNEYGDYIDHSGTTEKFLKLVDGHKIAQKIPDDCSKYPVYNFIQFCKENNITLYAMMPNYYHTENFSDEEKTAFEKIKSFYEQNGVEFIGDIKSGSYPEKTMFYDTGYHTNETGTKVRTDWIIENVLSIPEIKNINKN